MKSKAFQNGDMVYVDPFGPSTFGYSSNEGTVQRDKAFKPKLLDVDINTKYEIIIISGTTHILYDDNNEIMELSADQLSKTSSFTNS